MRSMAAELPNTPDFHDIPSGFDYSQGQGPYLDWELQELDALMAASREIDAFHQTAQAEYRLAPIPSWSSAGTTPEPAQEEPPENTEQDKD